MHLGRSVVAWIASTWMSMSQIGLSLPSLWFCLDSQSAMKIWAPGLYIICIQYWCIFNIICCISCDSVAMSFLNIVTSGL